MGLFGKILGKEKPVKPADEKASNESKEKPSEPLTNNSSETINATPDDHPMLGYRCVSCGLYPVEILMIAYSDKYNETQEEFPGFWTFKYNMAKPKEVLDHVANLGFIELGSPFESLNTLKIDVLKGILKEKSLPITGKKEDLIERIKTNYSETEVEPYVERHYKPSESGQKAIKDNDYIPFLHLKSDYADINPLSINRELKGQPCSGFEQLEAVLIKIEDKCTSEVDKSQLRICREMLRCHAYEEKIVDSDDLMKVMYEANYQTARNYLKAGFTRAIWVCTSDDKCCPICREMSEKRINLLDEHLTLPPAHKGCRCTIVVDADSYNPRK